LIEVAVREYKLSFKLIDDCIDFLICLAEARLSPQRIASLDRYLEIGVFLVKISSPNIKRPVFRAKETSKLYPSS
jgi:hypothetical protein